MANDHRSIAERCMERHHFCDAINEQHYPPPDLAKSLVELYFQKVHPYECILHRGEFMHHYNNGLAGRDCSFRALCYAVFAAASRFSSDCRVTPSIDRSNVDRQAAGALYAAASGSFITPITLPCTLFDLQTMAVLSYVLVGSCSPMTAWFSVGMYLRRAQDVGAHLESTPRWSTSILKDQLRKRAFFYLFGRELQLCLSLGKASCIRHSTETIEHPFIIDDGKLSRFCEEYTNKTPNTAYNRSQQSLSRLANAPCWIAGQAYYTLRSKFGTQLKMLWSVKSDPGRKAWDWDRSIVKQIAEAIDKHIKYDIPAQARWNPEASSEHDLILTSRLRCLVAYFQIAVHRHLISTDPGELKICLAASNSMLDVLDHLRKRRLLEFTATYTPYFITPAALTFIYSACSEESCLSPLDRASSWASAHGCLKVLEALSNTTFQAEKLKSSLDGLIKSCIDEQLYPGSTELGKTIKGGSTNLSTILAISPEITIGQSLSDHTTQVPYPETGRSSEHLATVITTQSEIAFDPYFPLELFNVPAPQLDAAFFQHPGTQGVNFLQRLSPSNECLSFYPTLEWLGSSNSYPLSPAPEMSMRWEKTR
ncbi:hypothetical protein CROQUDRAFT_663905 [Cronartium quercuum f. sp. fusiforme G11]|uniref:Xylanolytic transcriptional activator regulatory domain-containing protein n=1 Tax=Cronartium quercuum f. sp. fusiforme G11 TaxID=708437 RepID=A0A9P6T7A5_9BASI|nr:hypothetical protein CROQUDRAFT_663905 [Cronartium quercuum f. sp. fusiforme G11]